MRRRKLSKAEAKRVIEQVTKEEGHKPKSVWDFVQGITAVAREVNHQDQRFGMEQAAKRLLDKVA